MEQENTVFGLKAQARRLRTALAEMKVPVTHAVALGLIARAQGSRNWEALEAGLSTDAVTSSAAQAVQAAEAQQTDQWLNWLDAALRCYGRTEEDLDELVHDALAPRQASDTNNAGMLEQLQALLTWHTRAVGPVGADKARKDLVSQLEEEFQHGLPLPESTANQPAVVGMRVSICAGSRFEAEEHFDALEWFANQSADEVSRLIADGLHNSSLSDEVALWFEEHSVNAAAKQRLQSLLARMRLACDAEQEVVGVTVDIDEDHVRAYVKAQRECGVQFSDEALGLLGIST